MKIIVDADACPVKEIIEKIAKKYQLGVIMVSNYHHIINSDYAKVLMVDGASQSADIAITNITNCGDIVVTQEVFITVYEKIHLFDSSRKFGPWINRIAINTCVTYLRKNRKVITLSFDETVGKQYEHPYRVTYEDDPELVFEKAELKQEIDSALMELSESYRLIIIMRFRMELSNQEIADYMGISKENVEVKVHRARKALRKIILRKWKERGLQYELPANK
jgi:RNA polymerase sigma-70 factor (ECF subfamily)